MEMRELKGDDIFTMMAIVGKLNLRDKIVELFNPDTYKDSKSKVKEDNLKEKGVEVVADIIQLLFVNMKLVRIEINEFLADLTDTDLGTISQLNFAEYNGLIIQFFKKPELKDFLSSITSLI